MISKRKLPEGVEHEVRDADGNVVEIQGTDGIRAYAAEPHEGCSCEWDAGSIVKFNPHCPNAEHRLAFRLTDAGPVKVENPYKYGTPPAGFGLHDKT